MSQAVILLTGGTGNLGSRVLVRFLEDPVLRFKLLVYAKTEAAAEEEVRRAVVFWGASWEQVRGRIEIVLGDITKEDLGLSQEVRDRFAEEVTHIIHCAANFKLNLPLEEAQKSIVSGTNHLVALAQRCRKHGQFRAFHYISTEEVGVALSGSVPETFLPMRPLEEYFNTYEYAKAEAEDLLRRAFEQDGFPVTIHRPAIIVGDAQTGKIINAQGFYYIIRDMFLHPAPCLPMNDLFQVNVIPVNFLADILYSLHDAEEARGQVYHLSARPEEFLTLRELLQSLQKIHQELTGETIRLRPFVSPKVIAFGLKIATFFTWGTLRETLLFQLDFLKFFFAKASFETRALQAVAKKNGLSVPTLKEYLPVLYRYYYTNDVKLASLQK